VIAVACGVVAGLFWLWRRHPQAAFTVLSLGVASVLTSEVIAWVGGRIGAASYLQTSLVYWIFCGVVVSVTWLMRNQWRNRAVTVAIAHGCLVIASVFTFFAPSVVPIIGLVSALAVIFLRGRGPRRTSPEDANRDQLRKPL
jgi:hypothetical protein